MGGSPFFCCGLRLSAAGRAGRWRAPAKRKVSGVEGAADKVARLIDPAVEALGYRVVRVRLTGGGRPVLQVMAERVDGSGITLDECAAISRAVSALIDVADPIASKYVLEVSSPGIDRPLVRAADFVRFAGREVRIETTRPLDGRRRFRGTLLGLDGKVIRVATERGAVGIAMADVATAKLVLTDALIAESLRQGRAASGDAAVR